MKKRKTLSIVSIVAFMVLVLTGITSFASDSPESVNEGDIIIGMTQKEEIVVKVNDDVSFTTTEFIEEETLGVYQYDCPHSELRKYRPTYYEESSYNKRYSDKYYKARTVDVSQCTRCGRLFYTYGSWSDYSHKYKFLGKTCTKCGYEK